MGERAQNNGHCPWECGDQMTRKRHRKQSLTYRCPEPVQKSSQADYETTALVSQVRRGTRTLAGEGWDCRWLEGACWSRMTWSCAPGRGRIRSLESCTLGKVECRGTARGQRHLGKVGISVWVLERENLVSSWAAGLNFHSLRVWGKNLHTQRIYFKVTSGWKFTSVPS